MSNFTRHLKSFHKRHFKEFEALRDQVKLKKTEGKSHIVTKAKDRTQQPTVSSLWKDSPKTVTKAKPKTPILDLCGRMIVEDGRPFSNIDSPAMQEMIKFGKKGAGDTSTKVVNAGNTRDKVEQDAENLRKIFIEKFKGRVVHLSADMATKDLRCFFGEKKFMIFSQRSI